MITPPVKDNVRQAVALAGQALEAGDSEGAERRLAPLLQQAGGDPRLLHMAGLVRMHQQRFEEAAGFFARARTADPDAAALAFSHATALQWLERNEDALHALREAIRLKPDHAEAYHQAGAILRRQGRPGDAEELFRAMGRMRVPMTCRPKTPWPACCWKPAARRRPKAFSPAALEAFASAPVKGALHHNYALALTRQQKNEEALAHLAKAKALNPALRTSDAVRAEILQEMQRHDEALSDLTPDDRGRSGQSGMAQIPQRSAVPAGPQR